MSDGGDHSSALKVSRVARVPRYTGPVANLTIAVDPEILRRARIRALERGESVNSYLAEALRRYAGPDRDRQAEALSRLDAIADKAGVGSPAGGRTWTRDDLHRG